MKLASMILTLFAAAALAPLATAQQTKFSVGTASASPGEKATGYIEVPAGSDVALNIPVAVIRGAKPGPVLALVAGSHGTEYASIIALEKIIAEADPAEISGTLIILPLVNVNSFEQIVPHLNPADNKNMNRMYPGKPDGTQTERAAWAITKQVIEKCDYLVDFHGGDIDENLRPYAYWSPTGTAKQDETSRQMVLAFGLRTIIIWNGRPADPNDSRYLDNTSSTRGKPSIAVEAGYAGTVQPEDVHALVRGSYNVMRFLKMLPGEAQPVEHPVWIASIANVTASEPGIFYPLVQPATYVATGEIIGYVTDFFGKKTSDARAPSSGIVLYIRAVPSLKNGDTIANIGVIADKSPEN
ncbi:MAG: succinylglutamate desuccinylase/aspartoacylase family protein [Candidatus Acidiferrales bacterium]